MTHPNREELGRRCGTCRHFASRSYVVNAMRLVGPERREERTICSWTPPAPFWAEPEYRPLAVRENRQRMDNARLVAADDGQQCAAWEPRQ